MLKFNCALLMIDEPKLTFKPASFFATPSTRGAAAPSGDEIVLNADVFPKLSERDKFVVISHECRHVWQIKTGYKTSDYKQSSTLSIEDYNAQALEVDAWAWTLYVADLKYGMIPNLQNIVGKSAFDLIRKRLIEISEQF